MTSARISPVAFLIVLLSLPLANNSAAAATPSSFAICNANVFDGARLIPQHAVVVRDGKIVSVSERCESSPETVVIDATGDTLLPGLFDSHVHADLGGAQALRQSVVFGVTTALDMGWFGDLRINAEIKNAETQGRDTDLADLRSAGILATAPRGHGTEYAPGKIPTISDASEAQQFVDARIAEGSDYIKIIYDNGEEYGDALLRSSNGERFGPRIRTISKETLTALIGAAHNRGKLAVVHVLTLAFAQDAINAGADGLEHIFADQRPPPDFAALVKAHRAFVTPTLGCIESLSNVPGGLETAKDPRLMAYLAASDARNLSASIPIYPSTLMNYANAEQAVRQLHEAGVPILAGTDTPLQGTAYGASLHRELQLLVRAGLGPSEALASATSIPAREFGLSDRGRIAPGMRADLLLVRGDPTQDITATRDIVAVWKAGIRCDREEYRHQISSEVH